MPTSHNGADRRDTTPSVAWARRSPPTSIGLAQRGHPGSMASSARTIPLSDMIMPPDGTGEPHFPRHVAVARRCDRVGTSLGVGSMKDGSRVEVAIDGIGSLVNALSPGA